MNREEPDIVVVTNVYLPIIGGITNYVKGLVEILKNRGYRTHVLAFPESIIRTEDAIHNRFAHRLFHESAVAIFSIFSLAKILYLRLQGRVVIVHSQSASFCLLIGAIARLFGARSVHTFHSPIDHCSVLLKASIPFSNAIACVSEEHRSEYVDTCGISPDSAVIPGGVDTTLFSPVPTQDRKRLREKLLKSLNLEDISGPLILFVGRIAREKGPRILFEAANILIERSKGASFILVGPIDQSEAYADEAESLQKAVRPGMRFYLVGNLDEEMLLTAYRAADVLAFPSLWKEPSGTVVVEAMSSGLPVVASNIGGLKSRVIDGVTGRLVEPGNPQELAEAILDIISRPEKMESMRRKSRELATELYSLERMADKYEIIYHRIAHH